MRDPDEDSERFEEIFRQVRSELGGVRFGAAASQADRIDAVSPKPASRWVAWSLAASLVILVVCVSLGWRFFRASSRSLREIAASYIEQDLTLKVGNAELIEHIAAIVDHRFVVVIWSYRGQGLTAAPANMSQIQAGRYRLQTLHEGKLSDGRTFVCSLFVPDEGAKLILEPPCIYARSADNNIIACSVSPKVVSTEDLANAIRSAGVDWKSRNRG